MRVYDAKRTALNLLCSLKECSHAVVAITSSQPLKGTDEAVKLLLKACIELDKSCGLIKIKDSSGELSPSAAYDAVKNESKENDITFLELPPAAYCSSAIPFLSCADGVVFIERLKHSKKSKISALIDAVDILDIRKLGFILI